MPALGALGQTIQVVDKSGKVVSTSRHIFDVFKIGRNAYNERKKEMSAKRGQEASRAKTLNRPGRAYTLDETSSVQSGRSRHSHRGQHRKQHHIESARSPGDALPGPPFYDSYPIHENSPAPSPLRRHSEFHARPEAPPHAFSTTFPPQHDPSTLPPQPEWTNPQFANQDGYWSPQDKLEPPALRRSSTTQVRSAKKDGELARQHTDGVDMNLAYGDIPPDFLYPGSPSVASTPAQDEAELSGLVGKVNLLLDEANCLRSGATATIAHLQKNPDAMAAVGLTLAEISNLVKKVSPTALKSLTAASPAVFSLLAHPQFLVAVGVAAGVTIIAFGGYKIVKRIQERREMESMADEALLPVPEMSRIETWRRGIADAEARSVGTSVDGEFITPLAHNLSRMNLAEDIRDRELERAEYERQRQKDKDSRRKPTSRDDERKPRSKAPRSVTSSRSSRSEQSKRSSSEPRVPKSRMAATSSNKSASNKSAGNKSASTKSKKTTTKKHEVKPSPLRRLLLV